MTLPVAVPPKAAAQAAVQTPEWHRFARYGAALLLAVATVLALLFVAPVAVIIVAGVLLALITGAAGRWVMRRTGMRFMPAVLIVYATLIVAIVVLSVTGFPWVARAFEILIAALRAQYTDYEAATRAAQAAAASAPGQSLFFTTVQLERAVSFLIDWVIRLLAAIFKGLAWAVYVSALGLFLSFLMHIDLGERGLRLLDRLPAGHQREVRLLLQRIVPLWARFAGATAIFASVLALGSLIEFVLLGVPFPILMALMTGVVSMIPSVGGLLSSLIVAVPSLLLGSTRFPDMSPWVFTAIVVVINSLITQSTYNFIFLPSVGKAVRLPISVVLIGVLASFALNSILFAFLVVPVLASLRIVVAYVAAKIQRREPFPEEAMAAAP